VIVVCVILRLIQVMRDITQLSNHFSAEARHTDTLKHCSWRLWCLFQQGMDDIDVSKKHPHQLASELLLIAGSVRASGAISPTFKVIGEGGKLIR